MTIQDRYQVQHLLGEGGFGQVWSAVDRTLEREVAIKFATAIAQDPQVADRFTAEARRLARLQHRDVVTIHDAGSVEHDGTSVPYLVMELLTGSTWQSTRVPAVVETGARIAGALAHLHAKGIVHRDVKPSNIMICADGSAVLMDLGIARDLSTVTTMTAMNFPGTPAYMAPEQLAGHPATAASDVYALGLVLVEKLTGKRGPAAQLNGIDRGTIAPNLLPLLDRMTALEPRDRPTAAESIDGLLQSDVPRGSVGRPEATPATPDAPVRTLGPAVRLDLPALERFGVPGALLVLVLWVLPTEFGFSEYGPAGIYPFLALQVIVLTLTATISPHSGGLTRRLGYAVVVFDAAGILVLSLWPQIRFMPDSAMWRFHVAGLPVIAAFCYRELRTRSARVGSGAAVR